MASAVSGLRFTVLWFMVLRPEPEHPRSWDRKLPWVLFRV